MAESPRYNFTGDGTTDTFGPYTFDVLGAFSTVIVKTKKTTDSDFVTREEGVYYTHDSTNKTVTFLSGYIPDADELGRIERYTSRDRTVDYIGGSTLREANLDNDANRLTSVTQEIEAGILDALRRNAAGTHWDGEGLPTEDFAPADSIGGLVTLGQLEDRLVDVTLTDLTGPIVVQHEGDGVTTDFAISGISGIVRSQATVYVENVYQSSYAGNPKYDILDEEHTAYPSGGGGEDWISFVSAPGNGEIIEIKVFTGEALAILPDRFVTGDNIILDEIGVGHINVGAGLSDRLMTFDADGDPTAERLGLQHLLAAGQTIPSQVLAALLDETDGLALDDFLKPPTTPVDVGGQKITSLGTPTASDDAATKAYVDGGSARFASKTMTLPSSNGASSRVDFGFQPHVVFLTARYRSSNTGVGSWVVVFRSNVTSQGSIMGTLSNLDNKPPQMTFTIDATGCTIRMDDKKSLMSWSQVAVFAIRG